jgi:hypothetical protein
MKLKQATETEKFNLDKYFFYTFLNSPQITPEPTPEEVIGIEMRKERIIGKINFPQIIQEPLQEQPRLLTEKTLNTFYKNYWADKFNRTKLKNIKMKC